jgi:hypothetical protein
VRSARAERLGRHPRKRVTIRLRYRSRAAARGDLDRGVTDAPAALVCPDGGAGPASGIDPTPLAGAPCATVAAGEGAYGLVESDEEPVAGGVDVDVAGTRTVGVDTDGVDTDGVLTVGIAGVGSGGTVTPGTVTDGTVTDGSVTEGMASASLGAGRTAGTAARSAAKSAAHNNLSPACLILNPACPGRRTWRPIATRVIIFFPETRDFKQYS